MGFVFVLFCFSSVLGLCCCLLLPTAYWCWDPFSHLSSFLSLTPQSLLFLLWVLLPFLPFLSHRQTHLLLTLSHSHPPHATSTRTFLFSHAHDKYRKNKSTKQNQTKTKQKTKQNTPCHWLVFGCSHNDRTGGTQRTGQRSSNDTECIFVQIQFMAGWYPRTEKSY